MKKILCTALLLTLSTTCLAAKYYSWTDENGKRCFSNIPQKQAQQQLDTGSSELSYSGNIKQIPKRQPGNSAIRNSAIRNSVKKKTKTVTRTSLRSTNRHEQSQKPFITEANYGVIDGKVWRVGKGLVTVSVRVGKGPTCNNMTVRATARNKNGRLVYIREKTRLRSSSGSTLVKKSKRGYNANDRSDWNVTDISVRCSD